jgi:hypothetical protein
MTIFTRAKTHAVTTENGHGLLGGKVKWCESHHHATYHVIGLDNCVGSGDHGAAPLKCRKVAYGKSSTDKLVEFDIKMQGKLKDIVLKIRKNSVCAAALHFQSEEVSRDDRERDPGGGEGHRRDV